MSELKLRPTNRVGHLLKDFRLRTLLPGGLGVTDSNRKRDCFFLSGPIRSMLPKRRAVRGQSDIQTMSKTFEISRSVQIVRDPRLKPGELGAKTIAVRDRRRSHRRAADITVFVYGHGPGMEPFHEEAHTLRVNSNGGLLLLGAPVHHGQRLLLTNKRTQMEQDCCVVFVGKKHTRTVEAGVAFSAPNPDFWQLPPEFGNVA
jgi:hypothetical protein